ncbi:MAG: hypothetical protein OEY17_02495 [Nitrosopumilus sp.]|nr:hypothetical protein [Nitrosopumilus sp.]
MLKIIIIALMIVSGLSIYGNLNLLANNANLQEQASEAHSKNIELSNQISSLASKISSLEDKLSEPIKVTQSESSPKSVNDKSHTLSIAAAAVRPILIRDEFFQNVQYDGTMMTIQVSTHEGTGLVLVNTAIPTGVDFQSSARTAAEVAEKYIGIDLSDTDIIFSITADEDEHLQAVDGQSAGAAMTVLLISSLQNKKLNDDVIMTGTINLDMSIGMVGGIREKSDAAGQYGASIFLVPNKQGVIFVEECNESKTGNFIYKSCSSEQKPLSPITEKQYGMKTIEVSNIEDALLYFQ